MFYAVSEAADLLPAVLPTKIGLFFFLLRSFLGFFLEGYLKINFWQDHVT